MLDLKEEAMVREEGSGSAARVQCSSVSGMDLEKVEHQLAIRLAGVIGVQPDVIEATRPLESYGLSSLDGLVLLGDLETWLGFEVPPSALADHQTLRELAGYLLRRIASGPGEAG
jgi:acyl carrier protein